MPYSKFSCPDGCQTTIGDCLKECRIKDTFDAGRCLSVRTLRAVAEQREWKGVPSTTQLLRGTREAFLTITQDYSIDPQSKIFALHGTKVHAKLEEFTPEGSMSEIRYFDGISSGAFDFYENGVLYDVKTYGSYAVAKTLGLKEKWVPDGYYVKGPKKGGVKWRKEWEPGGVHHRFDLAAQLNDYRMKLEREGFPVSLMVCEVLVRDGNTQIAKSRGIDFNGRLITVNKISDRWVGRYMARKADLLSKYLEYGELPPICRPRERWFNPKTGQSGKCSMYCDVRHLCDYGRSQMGLEEPTEE